MMKKVLVLFALIAVFILIPGQTMMRAATYCNESGQNDPGLPPCSQIGYMETPIGDQNLSGIDFIVSAALTLVNWFSWFIGLAAVVMGLYSGFLFITARDNANQITTARNTMMYAIIGIGVAIIAFSLVSLSKSLLGL